MASWKVAPAIKMLQAEVNTRWPNRRRAWDGTIGDTAHQGTKSDHNPDWKYDKDGLVRAVDIDAQGVEIEAIKRAAIADPRVAYVIWNRVIYRRRTGWKAERYRGSNPHDHHIHISLLSAINSADYTTKEQRSAAAKSTATWGIWPSRDTPPTKGDDNMPLTQDDLNKIAATLDRNLWGAHIPNAGTFAEAIGDLAVRSRAIAQATSDVRRGGADPDWVPINQEIADTKTAVRGLRIDLDELKAAVSKILDLLTPDRAAE